MGSKVAARKVGDGRLWGLRMSAWIVGEIALFTTRLKLIVNTSKVSTWSMGLQLHTRRRESTYSLYVVKSSDQLRAQPQFRINVHSRD